MNSVSIHFSFNLSYAFTALALIMLLGIGIRIRDKQSIATFIVSSICWAISIIGWISLIVLFVQTGIRDSETIGDMVILTVIANLVIFTYTKFEIDTYNKKHGVKGDSRGS